MSRRTSEGLCGTFHTRSSCVTFGQDSAQLFASGTPNRRIHIYHLQKEKPIATLLEERSLKRVTDFSIETLRFESKEENILSGTNHAQVQLWSLTKKKVIRQFKGHHKSIKTLCFHPFGDYFASGSADHNVIIFDIKRNTQLQTYKGHSTAVTHLAFTPDGRWLTSADDTGQVKLWDLTAGRILNTFEGHRGAVTQIRFHPSEMIVAISSEDGVVKLWDVESSFECLHTYRRGATLPYFDDIMFDIHGEALVCCSEQGLHAMKCDPNFYIEDDVTVGWGKVEDMMICGDNKDQLFALSYDISKVHFWATYFTDLKFWKRVLRKRSGESGEIDDEEDSEGGCSSTDYEDDFEQEDEEEDDDEKPPPELDKKEVDDDILRESNLNILNDISIDGMFPEEPLLDGKVPSETFFDAIMKYTDEGGVEDEKIESTEKEKEEGGGGEEEDILNESGISILDTTIPFEEEVVEEEKKKKQEQGGEAEKVGEVEKGDSGFVSVEAGKEEEVLENRQFTTSPLKSDKEGRRKENIREEEVEEENDDDEIAVVVSVKRVLEEEGEEDEEDPPTERKQSASKVVQTKKTRALRPPLHKPKNPRPPVGKYTRKFPFGKKPIPQGKDRKSPLGLSPLDFIPRNHRKKNSEGNLSDEGIQDLVMKSHYHTMSRMNVMYNRVNQFRKLFVDKDERSGSFGNQRDMKKDRLEAVKKLMEIKDYNALSVIMDFLLGDGRQDITLTLFLELLPLFEKVLSSRPFSKAVKKVGCKICKLLKLLITSFREMILSNCRIHVDAYSRLELSKEERIRRCNNIRDILLGNIQFCVRKIYRDEKRISVYCKKDFEELYEMLNMFR